MASNDKEKIRRLLLTRLKQHINKKDLEKKIDGFVEEYIEKCRLIEKYSINNLPSKKDIKWWFQDKPEFEHVELKDGTKETTFEVDIDSICLNDSIATDIFKIYYDWCWDESCKLPYTIKELIKIYRKFKNSKTENTRNEYKERLSNIALVGTIRLNRIERKPYLCPSEIIKCCNSLLTNLELICNKSKTIQNKKIYIFDAFNKMRIE